MSGSMNLRAARLPERIVCLTEEPTEILYGLGEQARIVGISAWTERPARARQSHPVVSAFTGGSVDKIRALEPDLCIGFSDIQGKLARELVEAGLAVLIFNQRSVGEILDVILRVGHLVGAGDRALEWTDRLRTRLDEVASRDRRNRPRVYFEEWDEPQICGIRWVSELIEIGGGVDVFAERARAGSMAQSRTVTPEEVVQSAPDVVLASWCGKPFDPEAFAARPGFADLPAVREGRVHEVEPAIILQPGPAALTAGLDRVVELLAD
jgi:iron complex transport system substrate-binding protein